MMAATRPPSSVGLPSWRVSPQIIDPLGALGTGPLSTLAAVVAFGYAVFATTAQWAEVSDPTAAIAAVIAVAAACAVYYWARSPASAPFDVVSQTAVIALALLAALLEALGRSGGNRLLQDDFGQVVVGVLLLAMAPYRPALSLLLGSIFTAMVLVPMIVIDVSGLGIDAPFVEYAVVVVVPPLALGFAGAAFSDQFVRGVKSWHRSAARAAMEAARIERTGLARSVQQEQVTLLSQDVLPYLMRVAAAAEVSGIDVTRARSLSDGLRGTLVAEIGRTWLDDAVETLVLTGGADATVDDPDSRALHMSVEQRTACAALASAMCDPSGLAASSFVVRLGAGRADMAHLTMTATLPDHPSKREVTRVLVQYLAVVRVLFERVRVDVAGDGLSVGFEYAEQ